LDWRPSSHSPTVLATTQAARVPTFSRAASPVRFTTGRVAAFGLILFVVGNELSEPALRQVLEILAGVLAAAGLLFE
jgi:hypothetical protein